MNTERLKNGDVIFSKNIIALIASIGNCGKIRHHCYYHARFNMCSIQEDYGIGNINDDGIRLATDEEKQKLFNAIKANGYKWNEKTKNLEKLIEPNGDKATKKHESIYSRKNKRA